jgi:hypothetical protein
MNYDYIIIGGGISGLYAVQEFHKRNKSHRLLILDERDYWGGRLVTHKTPQYEIGGARFHDNHPLLLSLLKKYNCHKVPISSKSHFLHQNHNNLIIPYHNANMTLETIMKNIIERSRKTPKSTLQKYTLKEWIIHLSKDPQLAKKIRDIFGYDSEITQMNAYDSLISFERDFLSNQFYVVKEGFSKLCRNMYDAHKDNKNIDFCSNRHVNRVKNSSVNGMYEVSCFNTKTKKEYTYKGSHLIFATKAHQLREFTILKPIFPLLSCVYGSPLMRIYAKYPLQKGKVWFEHMPKIVTNAIPRQIIPIDPKSGLIMISYTDGQDLDPFWKDKRQRVLKEDNVIKQMIQDALDILFPHLTIPKPTYFKTHLWTIGCHHWKKGCDSEKIAKQIRHPLPNVSIVGEAFSHKQAWSEGALETVRDILI